MAIYANSAKIRKVEDTHTLQEFISLGQSADIYDYLRFSMVEKRDGVSVVTHNVLDDYIEDMKDQAFLIHLDSKQIDEYKYNPKKLSYKLYGTTTLYHIILRLNNLANVHEFTLKSGELLLFNPSTMKEILAVIYNNERAAISNYNSAHDSDSKVDIVYNDRVSSTVV